MTLHLIRETLLEPLQTVIGVVEAKQTLPVLSNVLLNIEDNRLLVTGTDLEVELIGCSTITHTEKQNTSVTLPGRKLIDICKSLPANAAIELFQEKEQIVLKSGKSRFTLSTLPVGDFPTMDNLSPITEFAMPQMDVLSLLKRTAFSMAQHDVRYYLNGILLEVTNSSISMVATDGHRLSMSSVPASTSLDHKVQTIIPRKGALELIRLLENNDTPLSIEIGNSILRAKSNSFIFTTKLLEGRFPDYNRVIPKNNENVIRIEKNRLINSLKRNAILCNEKFKGVRFEIRSGFMKILSNNPEQETAEEILQIDYTGSDIDIGFNVNYLIENLNIIQTDIVQLSLADSNSSMLINEVNTDSDSQYVLMPMRL